MFVEIVVSTLDYLLSIDHYMTNSQCGRVPSSIFGLDELEWYELLGTVLFMALFHAHYAPLEFPRWLWLLMLLGDDEQAGFTLKDLDDLQEVEVKELVDGQVIIRERYDDPAGLYLALNSLEARADTGQLNVTDDSAMKALLVSLNSISIASKLSLSM